MKQDLNMTTAQFVTIRGIRANYRPRAVRVINRPQIPMLVAHTPDGAWLILVDGQMIKRAT